MWALRLRRGSRRKAPQNYNPDDHPQLKARISDQPYFTSITMNVCIPTSLILPLSIKEEWFFLIFVSEKSTNCFTWSMPTTLPDGPTYTNTKYVSIIYTASRTMTSTANLPWEQSTLLGNRCRSPRQEPSFQATTAPLATPRHVHAEGTSSFLSI